MKNIFINANGLFVDASNIKYSKDGNVLELYRGDNFLGLVDLGCGYLKYKREDSSTKYYEIMKR